jgi:hypothetical protein
MNLEFPETSIYVTLNWKDIIFAFDLMARKLITVLLDSVVLAEKYLLQLETAIYLVNLRQEKQQDNTLQS